MRIKRFLFLKSGIWTLKNERAKMLNLMLKFKRYRMFRGIGRLAFRSQRANTALRTPVEAFKNPEFVNTQEIFKIWQEFYEIINSEEQKGSVIRMESGC